MAWGRYTGHRKSREKDSLWRIERVRRFDLATSRKRINSNSRLLSFTTFNNTETHVVKLTVLELIVESWPVIHSGSG